MGNLLVASSPMHRALGPQDWGSLKELGTVNGEESQSCPERRESARLQSMSHRLMISVRTSVAGAGRSYGWQ